MIIWRGLRNVNPRDMTERPAGGNGNQNQLDACMQGSYYAKEDQEDSPESVPSSVLVIT